MVDQNKEQMNSAMSSTSTKSKRSYGSNATTSTVNYEDVLTTAAANMTFNSTSTTTTTYKSNIRFQNNGSSTNNNECNKIKSPQRIPTHLASSSLSWTEDEVIKLSSLPQKPISNFPSEDDRKRVLGCLAAILSRMNDDQVIVHNNYSNKNLGIEQTTTTLSNVSVTENITNNNNYNTSSNNIVGNDGMITCHDKSYSYSTSMGDGSFFMDDDNDTEVSQSQKELTSPNRVRGSRWGRKSKIEQTQQSSTTTNSNNTKINNIEDSEHASKRNVKDELSSIRRIRTRPEIELMLKQYRKRRHGIYTEFLVSTADLLFLDKGHAIAFTPLLVCLLDDTHAASVNTCVNNNNNTTSSRENVNSNQRPSKTLETNEFLHYDDDESDPGGGGSDYNSSLNYNNTPSKSESKQIEDQQTWYRNDILTPFLESLSPSSGYQCLVLLLVNHLLCNGNGYDARIRHVIKKLGVVLIVHELNYENVADGDNMSYMSCAESQSKRKNNLDDLILRATRKFEALEQMIASKLLMISEEQEKELKDSNKKDNKAAKQNQKGQIMRTPSKARITRDSILRGLVIGSVGLGAGTLFAVTGGLAAPGIAAGLAASGLTTAATAGIVTTLTSTAAVTTIFGVGGGSIAAYKTHRRIQGLTEFSFQQECKVDSKGDEDSENNAVEPELFSTICLSGWLKDDKDFQRPWGVEPTSPPITDRIEKLTRFYLIHRPENVPRCQDILKAWKGDERRLWSILKEKYGTDPDHLLPIRRVDETETFQSKVTHEEKEIIDNLLQELGYPVPRELKTVSESYHSITTPKVRPDDCDFDSVAVGFVEAESFCSTTVSSKPSTISPNALNDTLSENMSLTGNTVSPDPVSSEKKDQQQQPSEKNKREQNKFMEPWDYHTEYGGELYTVRWESDLLMELCDSVTDMAVDLAGSAAKEILKQTALATLITAIAFPVVLLRAADMIDGTWTLAIERADLAGIELARSLLESSAGHRPVVLVGFSMGARTIYSCLKELARHQELWEEQQQQLLDEENKKKMKMRKKNRKIDGTGDDTHDDDDESGLNFLYEKNTSEPTDQDKKRQSVRRKKGNDIKYTREPASIVEDAILMGTPNHLSLQSWEACRTVVAGRLVNCYSQRDWILSLMFQMKRLAGVLRPVCGTNPVLIPGVENYDVQHFINSHSDYCGMVGHILRFIKFGQPYRSDCQLVVPSQFQADERDESAVNTM